MDTGEVTLELKKFIERDYLDILLESHRTGENFLLIDFNKLASFNLEFAELLLDEPEDFLKCANDAVKSFENTESFDKIQLRFHNLPDDRKLKLRDIRSENLDKLYVFEGVVRQKSDVLPQVVNAKYECPSCGNIISILQKDKKLREPSRCCCGRKGKFILISEDLIDVQSIILEESTDTISGNAQAKRKQVILKDDLVSPIADARTNPGTKIQIVGIVRRIPIVTRTGGQTVNFNIIIEANSVESIEDSYADIELTGDDEKKIIELSKSPDIFEHLVQSVAPSTYGYQRIREAITLQLFGGVKKIRQNGLTLRGDFHILLIGDPGAGKSALLKTVQKIAPRARYTSGRGASAAGLTATVVRDELTGGWALEAGTFVLANKGFVMLDEMDKMSEDDRTAMHEVLEQQTVSISKANIQATLNAETTLLAAANPKHGRFDSYEKVAKQINLPSTLINRFDLIFPIRDLPNKERDEALATFILEMHQDKPVDAPILELEFVRKYISYARQNVFPELTDNAFSKIKSYFVKMRNQENNGDNKNKPIPISARQLQGLVRLAEASARTRLSEMVLDIDVDRAIELTDYFLLEIGTDPKTGKIDIDRFASDTSASDRSDISKILHIIKKLTPNSSDMIMNQTVINEAANIGINSEDAEELIEKLKNAGDIYSPRQGYIARMVSEVDKNG